MAYVVIVIKSNGTISSTEQAHKPSLDQLQKAVGGYIQEVLGLHQYGDWRRGIAFCNEEGQIKDLPRNTVATTAWQACLGKGPFRYDPVIYGNMIFYAKVPVR